MGSGTGKYKNHRLFYAKPQHASLVPILGLMKAEEYLSSMGAGANNVYEEPVRQHTPVMQGEHCAVAAICLT